ncbi:SHBG isoform 7 [Pan troglodytes]|uniref:Sex hormone-binding globulin n=1 Tax=Pan troglodytes TaxID=9598 RepID=A0A2J8KPD2_PANTR|nr:SHBG isoform 7 [Pan troglodytes]
MESRGPLATSRLLLLLLLLLLRHTHQGWALRPVLPTQSAHDPPAVHLSNGPGQEPIAVMTFDLTKITKTSSSFEVRTWDPEGVIFYGDTNPKDDWFMLGLRDGRPEIQLHNHWAQLTVGAVPETGLWAPDQQTPSHHEDCAWGAALPRFQPSVAAGSCPGWLPAPGFLAGQTGRDLSICPH